MDSVRVMQPVSPKKEEWLSVSSDGYRVESPFFFATVDAAGSERSKDSRKARVRIVLDLKPGASFNTKGDLTIEDVRQMVGMTPDISRLAARYLTSQGVMTRPAQDGLAPVVVDLKPNPAKPELKTPAIIVLMRELAM